MIDTELQLFAADVRQLKEYVKVGHLMAQTAAKELNKIDEALGTKEREQFGGKLKDSVTQLVHMNYNLHDSFEAYKETSKQIKDRAAASAEGDEEEEEFDPMEGEQMFDATFDTIHAKTPTNVQNDVNVKAFETALGLTQQRQSMGDEELQVQESAITSIPKDPCTQAPIEYPVKNTVCGHIYDRVGIEGYLTQKGTRKARCPTIGCVNKDVQRAHLVDDTEMVNLIHRLKNSS